MNVERAVWLLSYNWKVFANERQDIIDLLIAQQNKIQQLQEGAKEND